jgi:hypothetical protein
MYLGDRPDDGGSTHLWNVGQHPLDYMAVHPEDSELQESTEFIPYTTSKQAANLHIIISPVAGLQNILL